MSTLSDVISAERSAVAQAQPVARDDASTTVGSIDARPVAVRSADPDDFERPRGREEQWRFTPMSRIAVLLDGEPSDETLTVDAELSDGVVLEHVEAGDPSLAEVPLPMDRLAALALARSGGAMRLRVAKGTVLTEPVVVRLTGTGSSQVVWAHVVVDIGESAEATIVLEHSGSARYSALVSVLAGDDSHLRLVAVQGWSDDSVHAAHVGLRVGRSATVRSTQVTLGGALVRITETVEYAGPGGDVELAGLYLADSDQHFEHRLLVDHSQPDCRSNVVYKGALQGERAHTVWVGDVLIRAAATGTDTYELNRNLVLTDGARADSVPNLEIETGEILGAGHASATGRFDDEQLFYLQARGIPVDQARRMVVRGFFAELIDRVGVPDLQQRLLSAVDDELAAVL